MPLSNAQSTPARFPQIDAKNLNGSLLSLPDQMPGSRTIVLVAFEREQQKDLDAWSAALKLSEGTRPWLETPIIDQPGAVGQFFIDNGMRSGIPDHAVWKHVVTLYTNKQEFLSSLQIEDQNRVYVLVVDRKGDIHERVSGKVTDEGIARIVRALETE